MLFLRKRGIFHLHTCGSSVFEIPSEGNEFIVEEKGEKCIEVRKGHRKEKELLNDEVPNKCFSGEFEWPTCTS